MSLSHLTDYLQRNSEIYGPKLAVVCGDEQITWAELWEKVQIGSAFFGKNIKSREQKVIGLFLPNSIDFIVGYLSVIHSGHICLPFDPAYKKLELDAIHKQIPSDFIITNTDYIDLIEDKKGKLLFEQLFINKEKSTVTLRLPADKQIASLTFTSGTTGTPKSVPNTHANHIWNIEVCTRVWEWTNEDSLLISLPLSHWYGLVMGLSGVLYHGNTLYLQKWFDVEDTLQMLSSGNITFFTHAASAYVKIIQFNQPDYDLSKVRLCVSGGAPLPPAVWEEFKGRYGIKIIETYGSSETGRIAANRLDEQIPGSPGKVLPEVDLKLASDGEVLIKSGGVFPGYFNNRAATLDSITADGYWKTGDIAELRNGAVFLKGRRQERIRRFGYTVSPRDVEWALHKHKQISDIYVIGRQIPGQPTDELIYFIVGTAKEEEILDFCKENLIFAWRPDKIISLEKIPRTKSGKVSIPKLKQIMENLEK